MYNRKLCFSDAVPKIKPAQNLVLTILPKKASSLFFSSITLPEGFKNYTLKWGYDGTVTTNTNKSPNKNWQANVPFDLTVYDVTESSPSVAAFDLFHGGTNWSVTAVNGPLPDGMASGSSSYLFGNQIAQWSDDVFVYQTASNINNELFHSFSQVEFKRGMFPRVTDMNTIRLVKGGNVIIPRGFLKGHLGHPHIANATILDPFPIDLFAYDKNVKVSVRYSLLMVDNQDSYRLSGLRAGSSIFKGSTFASDPPTGFLNGINFIEDFAKSAYDGRVLPDPTPRKRQLIRWGALFYGVASKKHSFDFLYPALAPYMSLEELHSIAESLLQPFYIYSASPI